MTKQEVGEFIKTLKLIHTDTLSPARLSLEGPITSQRVLPLLPSVEQIHTYMSLWKTFFIQTTNFSTSYYSIKVILKCKMKLIQHQVFLVFNIVSAKFKNLLPLLKLKANL